MNGADAFNAFEAAGWERQVDGYETFFVPITGRLAAPLLDAARVGRGSVVLDVATGSGPPMCCGAGLLGGTVRASALVSRQPVEMQEQIRAAFDRIVGGAEELPVSVKLATAVARASAAT